MKLLNTLRQKALAMKEKGAAQMAEQKAVKDADNARRGKRLTQIACEYTGGYREYNRMPGIVAIHEHATVFRTPFNVVFEIPHSKVEDVKIEGDAEFRDRVTITRVALIGLFALAAKKRVGTKETFMTIIDGEKQEAVFYFKNRSPLELKRQLGGALGAVTRAMIGEPS